MRIGIIGGGAIGLLLASLLSRSGQHPILFVRSKEQKNQINKNGILYLPDQTTFKVQAEQINDLNQMDIYIVCVKQHDIRSINYKLKDFNGAVIYLQNGMGHIDLLSELKTEHTIILGTCEHGAKRKNQRTVIHTGRGKINLALYSGKQTLLMDYKKTLSNEAFPIEVAPDWEAMLVNKLLINMVINPITALFQVKNGDLLTNPHLHTLAKLVCKEACTALKVNEQKHWERIVHIIEQTKENDSSMKEDISYNRKSEIEAILGYVLNKISLESSVIHFLYLSIKALEEQKE
ncbi:2-dehydropantoate 2-reductase [Paraliobacillus sp. JSM ZJ581]|uniref:2-dehydropantoate 2-reductase n=1 Tax=Paraliobacillus sp. JSM ZJ581 TaxID=3342118 RepID=UPI0035A945F5